MRKLIDQMNTASLLTAMQELKIQTIFANYSGSDDSGCVDCIRYIDKNNENNNPDQTKICLIYSHSLWGHIQDINSHCKKEEILKKISEEYYAAIQAASENFDRLQELLAFDTTEEKKQTTLQILVEDFVYSQLYDQVPGWEIDDGSAGTIKISIEQDTSGRHYLKTNIEHKSYFTDYELSSYSSEFVF